MHFRHLATAQEGARTSWRAMDEHLRQLAGGGGSRAPARRRSRVPARLRPARAGSTGPRPGILPTRSRSRPAARHANCVGRAVRRSGDATGVERCRPSSSTSATTRVAAVGCAAVLQRPGSGFGWVGKSAANHPVRRLVARRARSSSMPPSGPSSSRSHPDRRGGLFPVVSFERFREPVLRRLRQQGDRRPARRGVPRRAHPRRRPRAAEHARLDVQAVRARGRGDAGQQLHLAACLEEHARALVRRPPPRVPPPDLVLPGALRRGAVLALAYEQFLADQAGVRPAIAEFAGRP